MNTGNKWREPAAGEPGIKLPSKRAGFPLFFPPSFFISLLFCLPRPPRRGPAAPYQDELLLVPLRRMMGTPGKGRRGFENGRCRGLIRGALLALSEGLPRQMARHDSRKSRLRTRDQGPRRRILSPCFAGLSRCHSAERVIRLADARRAGKVSL